MQGIEVFKFYKGEKVCEICGKSLRALNFTQAGKAFVCSRTKCQQAYDGHGRRWCWVGDGERKSHAPGCPNYAPAGWNYPRKQRFFVCNEILPLAAKTKSEMRLSGL